MTDYSINPIDLPTDDHKHLYDLRSIVIATFLGSPLAGSMLMRRNYLNTDKKSQAASTLWIGIIITVALFLCVYLIPPQIMESIPSTLIPIIYTVIIYFLALQKQGPDIREHQKNNGPFYSAWRAVGIGLLYLVIIMVSIFGYLFLVPESI